MAEGRSLLTVAWTRVPAVPGASAPAAVSVRVTSGSGPPVEKLVEPGGTTFEIGSGSAQLAVRVLDKAGEILDRETRTIQPSAADGTCPDAGRVRRQESRRRRAPCRPRTPRCTPAASSSAPIAWRFVSAPTARRRRPRRSPGRLIDRRGATLIPLRDRRPLQRLAPPRFAARLHRPRRFRHRLRSAERRAPRRSDRAVAGETVASRGRGSRFAGSSVGMVREPAPANLRTARTRTCEPANPRLPAA